MKNTKPKFDFAKFMMNNINSFKSCVNPESNREYIHISDYDSYDERKKIIITKTLLYCEPKDNQDPNSPDNDNLYFDGEHIEVDFDATPKQLETAKQLHQEIIFKLTGSRYFS